MASSKPVEVVVAILLLLLTAFIIFIALFKNIDITSKQVTSHIEKTSLAAEESKSTASTTKPSSNTATEKNGNDYENKKESKVKPKISDIPIKSPSFDDEDTSHFVISQCILKEEYIRICKHIYEDY